MGKPFLPVLALCAAFGATAAQAQHSAADYDLFVLGNMTSLSSDTEGRAAVGGNATVSHYSFGARLPDNPSGYSLVVGGDLNADSGSTKGAMVVGGTASFTSWDSAGLAAPGTALPVDFSAESIRLTALSGALANYANTGSVTYEKWGAADGTHSYQITLTGTQAGLNVFTIDGTKFSDANTFTLDLTEGATALINVTGLDVSFHGGMSVGNASNVLWNFADTTNLTFYDANIDGSILAPLAAYTGTAPVLGQMIVGSFDGRNGQYTQVNRAPYTGGLLTIDPIPHNPPSYPGDEVTLGVPEPASWMTMLVGFVLIGFAMRRTRGATRFV